MIATGREGALSFDDSGNVRLALADASHVLSSVPPGGDGLDPVLETYGDSLKGKWLGYLSSTGVYGDSGGAWVDETAPTGMGRRTARAETDADWLSSGARVFPLAGHLWAGPVSAGPGARGEGTPDRLAGAGVQPGACRRYRLGRDRRAQCPRWCL